MALCSSHLLLVLVHVGDVVGTPQAGRSCLQLNFVPLVHYIRLFYALSTFAVSIKRLTWSIAEQYDDR